MTALTLEDLVRTMENDDSTASDTDINIVERVEFDLTELVLNLDASTQTVSFEKVPAPLAELGVFVGAKCSQIDGKFLAYTHCTAVENRECMFALGTERPWTIDLGEQQLTVRVVLTYERAKTDAALEIAAADADAAAPGPTLANLVAQSYPGSKPPQCQIIAAKADAALAPEEFASSRQDQAEVQEGDGLRLPAWQGDSYGPADENYLLPRLQLVEQRDVADRRPLFISEARSRVERDMVASARSAAPQSAVDPGYRPYRIEY